MIDGVPAQVQELPFFDVIVDLGPDVDREFGTLKPAVTPIWCRFPKAW